MAVEAKMGMGIVVILVCAFSFLVYHKYDLKQKALALANSARLAVDEPPAADNPEEKTDDRYAEFNASAGQRSSLAASTLDETAAPGFAGSSIVPDVVETNVPPAEEMLVTDFTSQDPQFDLSEPKESFAPPSARDVLEAREVEPQPFDTFTADDFGTSRTDANGDSFAKSEFDVEPSGSEPVKSESASELADFEPTSLQPAFDEPTFAAFDEPEPQIQPQAQPQAQSQAQSQLFPKPEAVVEAKPEFSPLPPASDSSNAGAFDVFDNTAPGTLPPVEKEPVPQLAVTNPKLQPSPFAEFGPLATDDPKPLTLFGVDEEPEPSAFEPEPLPSAVIADVTPQAESPLFAEFGTDSDVASGVEDSTPLRRPAPMPDFRNTEQELQPASPGELATTDKMTELARRDKLVAMSTSAPDVDVFSPAASPPPKVSRQFDSDSSGFSGFGQSEVPLPPKPKRVPAPASDTFASTEIRGGLSIPLTQPEDGVAHIVTPPKRTVQQVSGISEECDICEVQPDDNYWRISQRVYGTARYFSSLALYNRVRIPDPKKLRPGMKVMIPDPKLLEQKYPEFFKDQNQAPKEPDGYFLNSDGSPAYRIGTRETLSEISQKHLGRASRWIQIFRMNQHILKDPNKLKPGTVIALPEDATNVHLAP